MTRERREVIDHYKGAREWVTLSGYLPELEWQGELDLEVLTEQELLREYAWVVLNSGFRESVVRKHFSFISLAFCDWESADAIVEAGDKCVACAAPVFGNYQKLNAILKTASIIAEEGFSTFRSRMQEMPLNVLRELPYLGPVTVFHLAKNIGLDVAKPDRHLLRLAARFGYDDVGEMCSDVASAVGERTGVIDLVLWRFEERMAAFANMPIPPAPPTHPTPSPSTA